MNGLLATVRNGWSYRARLVGAGLVVGGVVSGGLLFATIPDQDGVLHGCYSKPGGAVRVIDNGMTACKASETPIDWNATGPKGDDGLPGDRGPSDAFLVDHRHTFSSEPLDLTTRTTVLSMSLPAGSYVVNATAAVVGNTTFGVVQCGIRSLTGSLAPAVKATVGGSAESLATIPLTAAFTLAVDDEVSLACLGDSWIHTQPSAMTAIQVQTVTDLSE
jgi:hypothetical protein